MNVGTKRASISVTITDIWPKFCTQLKCHTIYTPEWPNSHKLKIQDGGGRHLEFRKNVNNSGLDKDICTKFYVKMHHGHVEMTTWSNVGNKRASISGPRRALNLQVFSLSLCRTHLFTLLSKFFKLVIHILQTNFIKTALQQILYRKTVHSLSKVV